MTHEWLREHQLWHGELLKHRPIFLAYFVCPGSPPSDPFLFIFILTIS